MVFETLVYSASVNHLTQLLARDSHIELGGRKDRVLRFYDVI